MLKYCFYYLDLTPRELFFLVCMITIFLIVTFGLVEHNTADLIRSCI